MVVRSVEPEPFGAASAYRRCAEKKHCAARKRRQWETSLSKGVDYGEGRHPATDATGCRNLHLLIVAGKRHAGCRRRAAEPERSAIVRAEKAVNWPIDRETPGYRKETPQ